jgi:hypothetical protein
MFSVRKLVMTCLALVAVLLALPAVSSAEHHEGDVAAKIMEITYAAWKADKEKDFDAWRSWPTTTPSSTVPCRFVLTAKR